MKQHIILKKMCWPFAVTQVADIFLFKYLVVIHLDKRFIDILLKHFQNHLPKLLSNMFYFAQQGEDCLDHMQWHSRAILALC